MLGRLLLSFALLLLVAPAADAAVPRGWTVTGAPSLNHSFATMAVLDDGRVLLAGSWDTEVFDPKTRTWSPAARMPRMRSNLHVLVKTRDRHVMVVGGAEGSDMGPTRAVDLYDPARDVWVPTGSLNVARLRPQVTLLDNGKVLVAGGLSFIWPDSGIASAEVWDPSTGQWTMAGSMPEPRYSGRIVPLSGGRALVSGGRGAQGAPLSTSAIYEPNSPYVWTSAMTATTARDTELTLTRLPAGKVLAAGGAGLASAEIFDENTYRWTPTGAMAGPRTGHTAVALSDGRVMAAGGSAGATRAQTAEIYDARTGSWTSAGALNHPHTFDNGVLLRDGRVLLPGTGTTGELPEVWTPTTALTVDSTLDFGERTTGAAATEAVVVANTGGEPLVVDELELSGSRDFAIERDHCHGLIPAGATCRFDVRFTPGGPGTRTARLRFAANTVEASYSVPLKGVGLAGPAPDADGDGVADAADRCATLRGPTARQGCPSGLLADPSIAYRRVKGGIKVVRYHVKATTGARLVVTCSSGCRRTVAKGKGSRRVPITRLNGRRLKNGAKITITVSMPGRLTTTVTDRISRGRRIEGRPRCTPVGC